VLAFADTFGVDLFETEEQLARSVRPGEEMCGLEPSPALGAVAGWAMQQLLQQEGQQGQGYMAAHVRRGDWFYYCAGGCKGTL
jgi:hypothetical protein